MACTAVLSVALLGHASTVLFHRDASKDVGERAVALMTLQRFVERLREDSDWPGLYGRLREFSVESAGDAGLSHGGSDPALAAREPSDYYADFDAPSSLGTVTVLVQVPVTTVGAETGLFETASAPRYGLPADLNGDGLIRGASRTIDYHALPVVARLRWQRAGRDAREIVLSTWLRGGW